jgi:hypothetical protein
MITAATGWEPLGLIVARGGTGRWRQQLWIDMVDFIGRPPRTCNEERRDDGAAAEASNRPRQWIRLVATWREEGTLKG